MVCMCKFYFITRKDQEIRINLIIKITLKSQKQHMDQSINQIDAKKNIIFFGFFIANQYLILNSPHFQYFYFQTSVLFVYAY